MAAITRALISVHDKTNIVEFAKVLASCGVEILSTGGTAKLLREACLAVTEIADFTASPEIFEGRLKTLHPRVHGGILYKRGDPHHEQQARNNGIVPIDLVVVNLYPFERVSADPACTFDVAIENIDIGGPTMVRAAAKNHAHVAVVVDPADYDHVSRELMERGGEISRATRSVLMKKAFDLTARYDAAIASYLCGRDETGAVSGALPEVLCVTGTKLMDLRYGENPHQRAAFYANGAAGDEPSIVSAVQLHGKELSYNNIMDADAAVELIRDMNAWPYAVAILKHTNPCGAAVSAVSPSDAYAKALACDPLSAFGGIVAVATPLDGEAAALIAETFFEVIIALSFDDEATSILSKKKNVRLLAVPGLGRPCAASGVSLRAVTGGMLVQERDRSALDVRRGRVVTRREPTDDEWAGLAFAWRIVKHVKSNAVVFCAHDRTVGLGAGQMSRVDATRLAIMKARHPLAGTVAASDAFFPFRDGVDEVARAGATAIVQPGGSLRDEEAIAAADEHGMAMVFTGERHFRH